MRDILWAPSGIGLLLLAVYRCEGADHHEWTHVVKAYKQRQGVIEVGLVRHSDEMQLSPDHVRVPD
jgi:hypothetical protein